MANRTVLLNIRMTRTERQRLAEKASAAGMTVSSFLRRLVDHKLDADGVAGILERRGWGVSWHEGLGWRVLFNNESLTRAADMGNALQYHPTLVKAVLAAEGWYKERKKVKDAGEQR